MIGLIIRRAEPRDADDIAAAEKAYVDCPWNKAQILSEIQDPHAVFLTAETNGKFCGFVSGCIAADECEMSDIAVERKYRRRGVAYALMNEFLSMLRDLDVKSVFLLVRDGNEAATTLYEKCGFMCVGRRPGYYKGKDALIMRLTL